MSQTDDQCQVAVAFPNLEQEWLLSALENHRDRIIEEVGKRLTDSQLRFSKEFNEASSQLLITAAANGYGQSTKLPWQRSRQTSPESNLNVVQPTFADPSQSLGGISGLDDSTQGAGLERENSKAAHLERGASKASEASQTTSGRRRTSAVENFAQERISAALGGMGLNASTKVTLRHIDMIAGTAIVLNTGVMLCQLQYMGYLARVSLGQEEEGEWPNAQNGFFIAEHVFNAVFLVEFIFRISILRCQYFRDSFNLLDFTLVAVTSLHMYILIPLQQVGGSGAHLMIFRLLRFLRTIRVLRVVRVMRMFTELRILVQTFMASMRALVWSLIFLLFAIVLGALFLGYSLHDTITDPNSMSYDNRLFFYRYYGSPARSAYTLFEITLAGCWPTYLRPLLEKVSAWYSIFILLYVSIVVFALTRIIGALFLKETLAIATNDAETQAHEQHKKSRQYVTKLRNLFQAVDTSGDGSLTLDEFKRILKNPEVVVILKMFDVEVNDAEQLFHMLDTHMCGEITFDDFMRGMSRLKGPARSVDVVAMLKAHDNLQTIILDVKRQQTHQLGHMREVDKQLKTLHTKLESLGIVDTTALIRNISAASKVTCDL